MPDENGTFERAPADEAAPAPPEGRSRPGYPVWLTSTVTIVALAAVVAGFVHFHGRAGNETSQAVALTVAPSGPAPKVGSAAPDFRLRQLDGSYVQLSELRGHPVWVTFWATWCPPCRAESPDIEAASIAYRDDGLIVVAIDVGESPATVRDYVARAGLTFMVAGDESTAVAASYRSSGVPTHFFIDSEGILRDWQIGSLGKGAIGKKVAAILPRAAR